VEFGEKRKPECPTNEPGRRFARGPPEEETAAVDRDDGRGLG